MITNDAQCIATIILPEDVKKDFFIIRSELNSFCKANCPVNRASFATQPRIKSVWQVTLS